MINLKKFFQPNPCLLPVTKTEKEILECFLAARPAFLQWLQSNPQPRIRFQFYFPTAIDFYFDEFKLFTAYFKKSPSEQQYLAELKMTLENYNTIRMVSWKPFEEVMLAFLHTLEESNKSMLYLKIKSLHEYASLCEEKPAGDVESQHNGTLSPSLAAG